MTSNDPHGPNSTTPTRERVTVDRVERYPAEPVAPRPVEPVIAQPVYEAPVVVGASPVDTARRIAWLLFGVLQALIVLRIVLLLLGANEANDLVAFVVGVTDPFVEPFRGMFSLDEVDGASGTVLDVAAIVALIAWTLVEALVLGLIGLADRRATTA
jgi:uncharacterized protein YggT (Ycf19 family)